MRILSVLVLLNLLISSVCGLGIVTSPKIAWQGKVLKVKLISAEGISSVKGSFLGRKFPCYRKGDDYRGIIGVPINQKPGYYDLRLIVTKDDGSIVTLEEKMKLWPTRFPFSKFWLKPSRNKLRSPKIVNNEWGRIEKVLIAKDPKQRWEGKFIKPLDSIVTQGFGHRQIINGRRAGSHRGVDYRAKIGTPIKSPNNGEVVFVDKLKAFGGTLVIDHGQGIHTLYFHLSKIVPEVGDEVKKGEIIALSGNSGVSSGPHLHWGMSVHNLRVDPDQWVKYDI
ncbi:MAG: M23 family metallopeptidase [Candidatus Margulisiibacteriota bacterium]|nr:M23 family metallopeptidase [Candidatus Margulisiibacteriota bacterium]